MNDFGKDLADMVEAVTELQKAILKFRQATAFLERDADAPNEEKVEVKSPISLLESIVDESGKTIWRDTRGVVFNSNLHAANRDTGVPSETTAGTFRRKRGVAKERIDKYERPYLDSSNGIPVHVGANRDVGANVVQHESLASPAKSPAEF